MPHKGAALVGSMAKRTSPIIIGASAPVGPSGCIVNNRSDSGTCALNPAANGNSQADAANPLDAEAQRAHQGKLALCARRAPRPPELRHLPPSIRAITPGCPTWV